MTKSLYRTFYPVKPGEGTNGSIERDKFYGNTPPCSVIPAKAGTHFSARRLPNGRAVSKSIGGSRLSPG